MNIVLFQCKFDRKRFKSLAPYMGLVVYCVVGALLFFLIEYYSTLTFDHRATEAEKCIGGHKSYWAALFYVISICSTIGFGTLYPCTTVTRILSIIYSIIGIPLLLIVLADIGSRVSKVLQKSIVLCKRCRARRRRILKEPPEELRYCYSGQNLPEHEQSDFNLIDDYEDEDYGSMEFIAVGNQGFGYDYKISPPKANVDAFPTERSDSHIVEIVEPSEDAEDMPDIPVSYGLSLIGVCLLLCTVYYAEVENYKYREALYFSFITFLTGDFVAKRFSLGVAMYALIFLGFSMLSTTINIIKTNMDNLIRRVKREVQREIERIQNLPPELQTDQSPQELIDEIMKKQGARWLVGMMPKSEMENMVQFCEETIQDVQHKMTLKDAAVQTDPCDLEQYAYELLKQQKSQAEGPISMREVAVMCCPETTDKWIQAVPDLADASTEYDHSVWGREESTQTFIETTEKSTQFAPVMRDISVEALLVVLIDKEVQAIPESRSLGMQFPEPTQRNALLPTPSSSTSSLSTNGGKEKDLIAAPLSPAGSTKSTSRRKSAFFT